MRTEKVVEKLAPLDYLIDADQVAAVLSPPRKTIFRMSAKGRLPSVPVARCLRFDPARLTTWLAKTTNN
jgi:predicted DNA-binding transcriptional regulator AlpA